MSHWTGIPGGDFFFLPRPARPSVTTEFAASADQGISPSHSGADFLSSRWCTRSSAWTLERGRASKDSATLTHLASHGFAVAYSLHHATSGVRACANCQGIEAYLMHTAHPVMGLHAVLAAAYPDLSGQAFSANAKMKTPTTSTFRLPGRRKKAGRDVPPFPDSRVQTIPYDAS
ncbi:hypothetical protein NFJ02_11g05510 [Pycnococcus provasolii]